MTNYMTGRDPEFERQRLAMLANRFDERTFTELTEIGVAAGWNCLELGAGTGTVARWLLDRVGPRGHVVAVDLDTAALEQIGAPNLEVRSGDVVTMDLGEGAYDLVVARLFFEHIPEREAVLARCLRALKGGAWLWAWDADYTGIRLTGSPAIDEQWRILSTGVFPFGPAAGQTDVTFGARLAETLRMVGFGSVHSNRLALVRPVGAEAVGGTERVLRQRLTQLVNTTSADPAPFEAAFAAFHDPALIYQSAASVSAWGQKPVKSP